MGNVIKRRVTNIFDIPLDIMVDIIGKGLILDRDESVVQLKINVGDGLLFDNTGKIVHDREKCEELTSSISTVKDVNLSVTGNKLTFTKTLSDHKIIRNKHGHIIDIVEDSVRSETVDLIITDPCYSTAVEIPERMETPETPNFYK